MASIRLLNTSIDVSEAISPVFCIMLTGITERVVEYTIETLNELDLSDYADISEYGGL